MIPDDRLSSIVLSDDIIGGRSGAVTGTVDYEDGGIGLSDTSEGKLYQIWTGSLIGDDIILDSPATSPETVYTASDLSEFSFTFDQNMKPVLSFVQDGESKYRWYDSTISDYRITSLGDTVSSPKVFLDDKRVLQDASNDVILAYLKERIVDEVTYYDLYFRLQRDRFEIEYLLKEDTGGELVKFGMNKKWRLQFVIL